VKAATAAKVILLNTDWLQRELHVAARFGR
jgi:hypothetical protein